MITAIRVPISECDLSWNDARRSDLRGRYHWSPESLGESCYNHERLQSLHGYRALSWIHPTSARVGRRELGEWSQQPSSNQLLGHVLSQGFVVNVCGQELFT